jgi:hypothetical protein
VRAQRAKKDKPAEKIEPEAVRFVKLTLLIRPQPHDAAPPGSFC